jgi:hypothetical protein
MENPMRLTKEQQAAKDALAILLARTSDADRAYDALMEGESSARMSRVF